MPSVFAVEIARLCRMPVKDLQARWLEVFGEPARSRNKDYLWKRIAYRLQEQAFGGLSPRARARLDELLPQVDLRFQSRGADLTRDPRLPRSGTVIEREHGGTVHRVKVLDAGFEYDGTHEKSLSAIARRVTGTPWNGFAFFGLAQAGERRRGHVESDPGGAKRAARRRGAPSRSEPASRR
jgi:hypothetical protein